MRPAGTVVMSVSPSTSATTNAQRQNSARRRKSSGIRNTIVMLSIVAIFVASTAPAASAMRVDPERIAARLLLEAEALLDVNSAASRRRRQLGGTPKEETIQVTAPLFSGRLFDYGPTAGDHELTSSLDASKKLALNRPLSFYGRNYSAIYVLSNGAIGFEQNSNTYRANILPGNVRLMAPFWNRNDLRSGGHVYYREVTRRDEPGGRALERGQSEIRYQYDHEVKVQSAIVVTWDKMQPISTAPLPDENTNTFQAAIFVTTDSRTYANFIYSNIGWTQGAEAGFSNGDNVRHYALPTSGTGNIMYLEDYGNTGIPGEWMFALSDRRVQRCKAGNKGDTCDEKCGNGEWGADCESCCRCAFGVACNDVTGVCGAGTKREGACADCWTGASCQTKSETCASASQKSCAPNAALIVDQDRCGEPTERCECLAGFEGHGDKQCRDVDECAQPGTCHKNALCTNTPGHFFCQCAAGFNGDGVTTCVASFLYLHDRAQKLSHSRNAKVAWKLKTPLKLFGAIRERIIISSKGLIIVKEKSKIRPDDRLDDMDILGFAPFFAPIDYTTSGEVSVIETMDADVLTRVTQLVNENLSNEQPAFRASSVVIVTFTNVSTPGASATNTFQTLVIGGTNDNGEPMSFVQLLYKDLVWSDNAEAGIMTADKTNSIHLPGSGTAGIEQLSQLSNIRTPGIWMYRVDTEALLPCMSAELQPPYCDAQSPTLISVRRPDPTTTLPSQTPPTPLSTTTEARRSSRNGSFRFLPPSPAASTVHFPPPLDEPTTLKTATAYKPAGHTPAFSSGEISDMPSDVFDSEFPAAITVVPQLMSVSNKVLPAGPDDGLLIPIPGISIIQPEIIETTSTTTIKPTAPTAPTTTTAQTSTVASTTTASSAAPVQPEIKMQKPGVEFSRDDNETSEHNPNEHVIEIEPKEKSIVPELPSGTSHEQNIVPAEPTRIIGETTAPADESPMTNPLFVFATTTKKPATPKKTKYVIQKQKASTTEQPPEAEAIPFDPDRILSAEAPANKFAIIVTVSVVAGWLLVLVGVGAYVACKRRRNQDMMHTMYGPAYQIRPIGVGFMTRGGEKHQHHYETSYEDHLEKAARLSSELSAYTSGGKIVQYGSYWNLSNGSNSSRGGGGGNASGDESLNSPNTVTSPTSTVDGDTETVRVSQANDASTLPKYGSPGSAAGGQDDFSPLDTAGRYRPSYVSAATAAAVGASTRPYAHASYLGRAGRVGVPQHVIMPPHHIILPNASNTYLPYTRYPPHMR